VSIEKTNASEPLMTCRKTPKRRRNRDLGLCPVKKVEGQPVYCSTGVRHEGGVISMEALVRNVGTCRRDAKGEAQADSLCKSERTDARHRGGVARSRVERSVMEPDRRGGVVRLYLVGNP
jgi:hypothetical protein